MSKIIFSNVDGYYNIIERGLDNEPKKEKPKTKKIKSMKYIKFVELYSGKRKTKIVRIENISSGNCLGIIKWYGNWRQYCFFPDGNTVWSKGCLDEVNKYINLLNFTHKNKKTEEEFKLLEKEYINL